MLSLLVSILMPTLAATTFRCTVSKMPGVSTASTLSTSSRKVWIITGCLCSYAEGRGIRERIVDVVALSDVAFNAPTLQ